MKYAHFTIHEMKRMEEVFLRSPTADCNEISKGILTAKIDELNQAISNYQNIVALMENLLPMIETTEDYYCNEKQIDVFIYQIYEDIKAAKPLLP